MLPEEVKMSDRLGEDAQGSLVVDIDKEDKFFRAMGITEFKFITVTVMLRRNGSGYDLIMARVKNGNGDNPEDDR